MTEPAQPQKVDPETLVLRGKPPRVIRFKRNLVIGAAAIGCLGIAAVTLLGLRGAAPKPADQADDLKIEATADVSRGGPSVVQTLPRSYSDLPPGVPQLGAPLPGDLGRPVLEAKAMAATATPTESQEPGSGNAQGQAAGLFFMTQPAIAAVVPEATALATPFAVPLSTGRAGLALSPDNDQNGQERKLNFVSTPSIGSTYNSGNLQQPVSPYQIMAGTILSANLITGLDSDLPGTVIAQISSNTFDTVTGRTLLLPQGSRLIGEYDSVVAFGQSRALLIWKRLILPNGSSMEIDNMPATDTSGYAGLSDKVDVHTWSLLKGGGLSTLLGVTAQQNGDKESDLIKALRSSTQQTANEAGQRMVDKTLNVQPTIKVRPGWPLRVIVQKDLILKPYVQ